MNHLNPLERECQQILMMVSDLMAPGHPLTHVAHTELCGKVRDILRKLQNKDFGCKTGKHSGACQCL